MVPDSGDLTDDTDDMDGGSVDGRNYRLSDTPCGPTQDGQVVESLTDGTWLSTGLCMTTGERDYDALNLLTGYGAPNWDYENGWTGPRYLWLVILSARL